MLMYRSIDWLTIIHKRTRDDRVQDFLKSRRTQVQGVVAVRGDFCSGDVQAYTIRATFAMMAPLRSFVEGVPHGHYYSAHPSGGPLAFGTGGRPQAQLGRPMGTAKMGMMISRRCS